MSKEENNKINEEKNTKAKSSKIKENEDNKTKTLESNEPKTKKKTKKEQENNQTEEVSLEETKKENVEQQDNKNATSNIAKAPVKQEKETFKAFLKSFTPYQIIYLASVLVLVVMFIIFLPDEMLEGTDNTFVIICSVIAVIANPLCELMISKQNKWNFIVSVVFIEITESIVCLTLGLYATAFFSIIFWIPVDLISFFKWKKHPDEEKEIITQVKKLNWWQDLLMIGAICAFGFGVGSLLKLIPGAEETYIDAFDTAFGMANGLLLLARYNEQWFAWLASVTCSIIAYILTGAYIMLITEFAMLINTIYGFVKWLIYIKNHKQKIESGEITPENG